MKTFPEIPAGPQANVSTRFLFLHPPDFGLPQRKPTAAQTREERETVICTLCRGPKLIPNDLRQTAIASNRNSNSFMVQREIVNSNPHPLIQTSLREPEGLGKVLSRFPCAVLTFGHKLIQKETKDSG